jgi:hypothetical protein
MKSLKSRHVWRGVIFHEMVQVVLNRIRIKQPIRFPEAEKILRRKMENDWSGSKGHYFLPYPDGYFPLEEDFYITEPIENRPSLEDEILQTIEFLHRFYQLDIYKDLFATDGAQILEVEQSNVFYVSDIPVFGKTDLAVSLPENQIIILDWKTGKPGIIQDNKGRDDNWAIVFFPTSENIPFSEPILHRSIVWYC